MKTSLTKKLMDGSSVLHKSPIVLVFVCLCLVSEARAADGGIGDGNTAEGRGALENVTSGGKNNTAIGHDALFRNTTGDSNTASGHEALANNTTGAGNVANGQGALRQNTTGIINVATGQQALRDNTTGRANVANGHLALSRNVTGEQNIAVGWNALANLKSGRFNVAVGSFALAGATQGENNIAIGWASGQALTTGDNNIDIGNPGVAGESGTIRIGKGGHVRTFISGISGSVVTGTTVEVNAEGQVGVSPSSSRFKEQIKPMGKTSETLYTLEPVTFRYKQEFDPTGSSQFGLVAEEVEKVNPSLVVHDNDGKPYSVRYDAVNAMLLNEFLKEHRKVADLEKQVRALTAGLEKVTARVEPTASAPQTVVTNR